MSEIETKPSIAAERLQQLIERIERLMEEKKEISTSISDIFAEAKSAGFDVKAMKQVIRLRAMEQNERQELDTLIEVYRNALNLN